MSTVLEAPCGSPSRGSRDRKRSAQSRNPLLPTYIEYHKFAADCMRCCAACALLACKGGGPSKSGVETATYRVTSRRVPRSCTHKRYATQRAMSGMLLVSICVGVSSQVPVNFFTEPNKDLQSVMRLSPTRGSDDAVAQEVGEQNIAQRHGDKLRVVPRRIGRCSLGGKGASSHSTKSMRLPLEDGARVLPAPGKDVRGHHQKHRLASQSRRVLPRRVRVASDGEAGGV